jgi:hypothetical protein
MAVRAQSEPASALVTKLILLATNLGVFCNETQQLRKTHRLTVVEPYLQVYFAVSYPCLPFLL